MPFINNPELTESYVADVSDGIGARLRASGQEVSNEDIQARARSLVSHSAKEQQAGRLPIDPSFGSEQMEDLLYLSFILPERTSGFGLKPGEEGIFGSWIGNRRQPGKWGASSVGDTLDTLSQLHASRFADTPQRADGQKFRFFEDMSPEEQAAYARITPLLDHMLLNDPNHRSASQRFTNARVNDLQQQLDDVTKEINSINSIRGRLNTSGTEGADAYTTTNERNLSRDQRRMQLEQEQNRLRDELNRFTASQRRGA